jgi:hypothetical protein
LPDVNIPVEVTLDRYNNNNQEQEYIIKKREREREEEANKLCRNLNTGNGWRVRHMFFFVFRFFLLRRSSHRIHYYRTEQRAMTQ